MRTTHYQEAYEKLNKEQKMAVDAIDGPVMVIAGPGTGKTQILATRIAKILSDTDAQAQNILALTYTNAAAIAMRQRLRKFIGKEAYQISIYTFHSLGAKILQENEYLFRERNLQPISELEKIQMGNKLIDELPANNILRRLTGDLYYDRELIFRVINFMKTEKWDADKLQSTIEEKIKLLYEDKDNEFHYKKNTRKNVVGDLKPSQWNPFIQNMEKLKAAVHLFQPFQEKLKSQKLFDFSDMLLNSIALLQKHPDILANYQEQYQYLLVDEFQDTSGAQSELLYLIAAYWQENPNLFVVGDDDQSIYKFQGANLENIQKFGLRYKSNLTQIFLKENYRSTQNILDVSSLLINNNKERLNKLLGLEKKLRSNKDGKENHVFITAYHNPYDEALQTVKKVKELMAKGAKPQEIAIVYAKHKFGQPVEIALQNEDIAIQKSKKSDALKNNWVIKWIQVLQYLSKEIDKPFSADHLLFEVMHYPQFGIRPLSIALFSLFMKNGESKNSWRETIQTVKNEKEFLSRSKIPSEDWRKMKLLMSDLEYLIGKSFELSVLELAEMVLKKLKFLNLALSGSKQSENLVCIHSFFKFLQTEAQKKVILSLAAMLQNIELMHKNDISLDVEVLQGNAKGVHLLSAHGSKGLEFEHVFIIHATSQWEKKSPKDGLPYNMMKILPNMDTNGSNLEEKRRLFFVAMTRAKQNLFISYPKTLNGREMEPSQFIAELETSDKVELIDNSGTEFSDESMINFVFQKDKPKIQDLLNQEMIEKSLVDYKLSVTHLNTFLKCPVTFYYQNILQIPRAKNQYMAFGTAMHYALEKSFQKMLFDPNLEIPDVTYAIQQFKSEIRNQGDSLNQQIMESLLLNGKKQLTQLFERKKQDWEANKNIGTERKIETVLPNGIPIKGRVDKLIYQENFVDVVDYKTGKFSSKKNSIYPPQSGASASNTEKYFGGDYWRQVVFYKILVNHNSEINHSFRRGIISYIQEEDGQFNEIALEPNREEERIVLEQIEQSYRKIMSGDFGKTCANEKCFWCHFQKQQSMNKMEFDA